MGDNPGASGVIDDASAREADDVRAKDQSRRRLIQTEFLHKWISTCVATYMEKYGCKKDAAVVFAAKEFVKHERTIWNALSTDTQEPSAERSLLLLLQSNLDIAEQSNNRAAAKLLRRLIRHLPPNSTF
ncbi:MAG: hypothetical protein ABSE67_17840 [Xanthobacteraceae bacterium]|jgi:hypothetical protein